MVFIANEGYVKEMSKEIGWSFKNVLFVIKGGVEQSFRAQGDYDSIKNFLISLKNKDKFLKKVYDKISSYGANLKKLTQRYRKENLKNKSNKQLLKIFSILYQAEKKLDSVLQTPVYFEASIRRVHSKKIRELFKKASKARGKAAEMFYKIYGEDYSGFFREFSRRFNINLSLVKCLLPEEIKATLKTARLTVSKKVLAKRFKLSVLVTINRKIDLLVGQKADKFIKKYLEPADKKREIKGQVAYPGKVCGKAKIVIGKSDFPKIKNKDILIAPTTGVHYVPYLKKVAAIVTDEGGLTCHASLISREMKIPCIVGTKIATRVLNDGDLVEVDANRGLVRILKTPNQNKYGSGQAKNKK